MTTDTQNAPGAALNTSDGARCYIAHFFARELHRHDFATYIATDLAADFACALAQHLAARQSGVQEPVGEVYRGSARLPQARLSKPLAIGTLLYAAPPAQGIDLGLAEEEREWIDYAIAHMRDDSEPEDLTCADALERVLRRVDGQRDAALGLSDAT